MRTDALTALLLDPFLTFAEAEQEARAAAGTGDTTAEPRQPKCPITPPPIRPVPRHRRGRGGRRPRRTTADRLQARTP